MFEVWKPVWALALALAVGPVWAETAAVETPPEEPEDETEVVQRPEQREVTSVTQMLQEDAGVTVQTVCTNCNNADLSLGGLGNEHISIVCDGVEVPPGLAQVYLLSIVPPNVIDKVSVTQGPGEAELSGGAIGGGIEIERRRPEPGLALHASTDAGDFDWRSSSIDLSGKAGRIGGSLTATIAESDVVDANGDGSNELSEFDRNTLDASLEIEASRNDRLRFGFTSYDESQKGGHAAPIFGVAPPTFQFAFQFYGQEFVEFDRQQYDALYERLLPGGARLTAEGMFASRGQDVHETLDVSRQVKPTFFVDEDHRHGSLSWDQPVGNRTTMHFGASTTRRAFDVVQINYTGSLPAPKLLEETTEERGIWASAETVLGGSLELDTGLRWTNIAYDDNEDRAAWLEVPVPDGNRLLPRAALTWKPSDPVRIRFSVGAGFRGPEPTHDEVCCGRRYKNNRGVSTEKSWSAGVETIFQPSPRFKLAGSGFVTEFEDLVVKMVSWSDFLQLTYQNANASDARYMTLGFETRYDVTSWLAINGAASWVNTENTTPEDVVVALYDTGSEPFPRTFRSDRIPYVVEQRNSVGFSFATPRSGTTFDLSAQYTGDMLIQRFNEQANDPEAQDSDVIDFVESADFWVVNLGSAIELQSGIGVFFGVDNIGDYVQSDLGDPHFDYKWGPLRGRYFYGGLRYRFATR